MWCKCISHTLCKPSDLREPNPLSNTYISGGTFNSAERDVNNYFYSPQQAEDDQPSADPFTRSDFKEIQQDTLSKATDGTCLHFVEGETFDGWVSNGKILWGTGIRRSLCLAIPREVEANSCVFRI